MTYRARLLAVMVLVSVAITGLGLFIAERKVAAETAHDLEVSFRAELTAHQTAREIRQAALAERTHTLTLRPRIVAALEDGALDLLYPSAKDELRDLMDAGPATTNSVLRARFYRFLSSDGHVLKTGDPKYCGVISDAEANQLAFGSLPTESQVGYLWHDQTQSALEVLMIPILSSETGEPMSALVVGLATADNHETSGAMRTGILLENTFHIPAFTDAARSQIAERVKDAAEKSGLSGTFSLHLNDARYRLFYNVLNPHSKFPTAYEVCIYPLADLLARQQTLRWQASGICAALLLCAFAASHVASRKLSRPVEKLEQVSAKNVAQRQRAEAALEQTSQELQRAARFSADASHQLKTPVAVLRAGLDELLAREEFAPEVREELSGLRHQTFRLNNIIEDLLLLSRMDAGRLKLSLSPVDLGSIVEAWMDDLSAVPETIVDVETDFSGDNLILGEKRYTAIIIENLLENARKYNRAHGTIRITTAHTADNVTLRIANTGRAIPPEVQSCIFERFHRGAAGENVPGYGLGLNLARDLARLHGGELKLVSSRDDWTEFEVTFKAASKPNATS
jgi:signal transduction histidine kinase